MATTDVKVIGAWPSPFVMRARIALNIKSVDYEFLQEQLGGKSELLLKSNPVHKKIPVLIHGDKPVCESLVIVQYVDEWFPSLSGIARGPTEEAKKAALEQVVEGLALLDDAFVKCSKGKAFFGGDRIGYLDIALGCFLGWVRVTEKTSRLKLLDESKTPHLVKWADSFCADASVKDFMPETDKLAEFAKVLMAKFKAPPPS
ncbi:hypothetical protein RHGRI_033592 [Rhododendron griersonianum]|uniref:Glutathione S-transferase n=1 Tax=Rhododendron griersonianum TaxID=479676 RepID=A0AAV6I1N7_9ERIC|nr:hypothetical protein RHGRI_033592 [Rhododendron griersonianum]KAG5521085.1 hypothetical protein RHGRI_033592 [Rhododendron griersonianum]